MEDKEYKPIISEAFKFWSSFAMGFIAGVFFTGILIIIFIPK